jgi:hypothetical protein
VALVGVAALAVAGLFSWLVRWWFAPLDAVDMTRPSRGVAVRPSSPSWSRLPRS